MKEWSRGVRRQFPAFEDAIRSCLVIAIALLATGTAGAQALLPGGIVMTLFPPGSPYLNAAKVNIPEVYNMDRTVQGRVSSIVSIHNPSIEVHFAPGNVNTGTAVILAAGGGHNTLNVGSEASDFVPWLYNHGVTAIILRNRLRRDGYDPKTDEVYDAQQAIRLVRAHAKEWNIDPAKIGIMGFSAGAELAAPAAIAFEDFDAKNNAATCTHFTTTLSTKARSFSR